ncbi:hypothetical protein SAMN05421831_1085 [Allopseudospirillum japonicum]|uniref:Uncharacterized protein n=1 Tax=Allopseudospirillum japonicum TaxID=64971 RepID=A0A1H6SR03_9GAMM|nr:hypothetical protein [Allopseudospirillum japonicum]SEI70231.1 hypothetical protein SAMN05421831_1085 [Allopseudospirillum japonicum]
MNLKTLNRVCFTICILCIVAGVVLSLAIIWGEIEDEIVWKTWLTLGIFFLGAAATLTVSRLFGEILMNESKSKNQANSPQKSPE